MNGKIRSNKNSIAGPGSYGDAGSCRSHMRYGFVVHSSCPGPMPCSPPTTGCPESDVERPAVGFSTSVRDLPRTPAARADWGAP